ncbi:MAG TPA: ferredoxin--NADP reductase [Polyangiaceae bacterium]|nr:ferredoxin--NADP reductase [Polyangiaceae bacterium]
MSGYIEARVVARHHWAPGLMTLTLDAPVPPFEPGQFMNLGLELGGHVVRRSYSIASAPGATLEFLLTELAEGALTPALFRLEVGAPLLVDAKPQGFFTLRWVPPAGNLWMIATGTGLAPYISMLRAGEVLRRFERIVVVHGVREAAQLAYATELERLCATHPRRISYVRLLTREAPTAGMLAGRIPAAIRDGRLETTAGLELSPEQTHVLLCGNPAMIDDTMHALGERGLRRHRVRNPGHITTEKYWDT